MITQVHSTTACSAIVSSTRLRRALEERRAQFSFQGLDLLGEGRRGDVQPARRTAEAPFLGHRQEVPELAQLHEPPRYCSAAYPRPGHR
jgi:hypothetical protein